ncbi:MULTISPECIES: PTS mannose/fructose/sorbose transporter subunit IIAB [Vagococcus]|uniref:PTS mannose/fructose/sorbose transporter subunit IIAB n=1 Tax=Vagococcus TaxID=2737 RepID=UPI000E53AA5C|nr:MULTISPECIES: PTS mannose/fructose/sorbose transporter subunit IIAB [Vagococcus]RHH67816.1 PTS mannose/fructose/sorbose transporter subunit IIAB [Vagococcus sp. AM17-17]
MKDIILVSHGDMAKGVKHSLEMITGKQKSVHVVSLKEDGDDKQFESDLLKIISKLNGKKLIIADLLGGTPCNVALTQYSEDDDVDIIAGMSLPLVVEATLNTQATTKDLIRSAKQSVVNVKNQLEQSTHIGEGNDIDLDKYAEFKGKENIVNIRIDERLIHGQVAGIWSTSLNTQRIIVINNEAATDPLQKSSLRMAAPTSMRLSVLTIKNAVKNINSGKYGKQRLFILFKNPTDVLKFIEEGGNINRINVGNMSHKNGAREVTKSIKVTKDEEVVFHKIAEHGVDITAQLVPNDPIINFMEKLDR